VDIVTGYNGFVVVLAVYVKVGICTPGIPKFFSSLLYGDPGKPVVC